MLDTLVVLLVLVAFVAIPLGVGYMTRSSLLAVASAAVVTVPAALLQAFDTNLPGFAVPILVLGASGAITGVATAKRRGADGASALDCDEGGPPPVRRS
jgi:hypothetical protein